MALKKNIILNKYSWTKSEFAHVTGFTWLSNEHISGRKFAEYIKKNSSTIEKFKQIIENLNGQFSVIIEYEDEIWIAASHTWSYPVFYNYNKTGITISDDPESIFDKMPNPTIDEFSKYYFLLFGVTPQEKTLIKDIQQIKPGEIVVLKKDAHVEHISCFEPAGKNLFQEKTEENLHKAILSLFQKYYDYIKDKQILLPLTSGYDSRLLACLLKEFGHKNVICATWGRKGNSEVNTAKKVAEQLGYKHIFIEYNLALVSGFTAKKSFVDYMNYAGHLSSMPFLYDYFAIDYLKRNKTISNDTVTMPGYSGDYFAGSHLDANFITGDNTNIISKIISKYSSLYPMNKKRLKGIKDYIHYYFFKNNEIELWQKSEFWDFPERQCKFISNANLSWIYSEVDVLMPLFDKEFIDFFKQVSFEQRLNATLYNRTLEEYFFKPHKVVFNLKQEKRSNRNSEKIKDLLLKTTPRFLKTLYYPMNDDVYYWEITRELRSAQKEFRYKHPIRPNAYNSYIIQWYLFSLQQTLDKRKNIID